MSVSITTIATISDKFSQLINKNEYEPRLCNLMNMSKQIFPGQYEWIKEQSSGECDFVEIQTGTKFDAKLPFMKRHGKLIGSRKHDFQKWLELMQQEEAEFGKDIVATRGQKVVSLELYKIMECRLDTVKEDENVIFFFPYPIVLDSKDSIMLQFVTDFLSAIFNELEKNNKIAARNIYTIYPSIDGDIVLRCLNDNKREYLKFSEFDNYISYGLISFN